MQKVLLSFDEGAYLHFMNELEGESKDLQKAVYRFNEIGAARFTKDLLTDIYRDARLAQDCIRKAAQKEFAKLKIASSSISANAQDGDVDIFVESVLPLFKRIDKRLTKYLTVDELGEVCYALTEEEFKEEFCIYLHTPEAVKAKEIHDKMYVLYCELSEMMRADPLFLFKPIFAADSHGNVSQINVIYDRALPLKQISM